ncbi:MAG: nucleotidyltransferase domain-containing protein [Candidatus Longimicrobiales bacterium M2_2A_002]
MANNTDTLDLLGLSRAAARIFRFFLIRPGARPHAREIQRRLDLGGASLKRELDRMVELGALRKEREGRRTHYSVIEGSPVWQAIRILESTSGDPAPLLEEALADVPGLEAAFIFGSAATGSEAEESDVDVFVVEGPGADRKAMFRNLAEAAVLLGREVNPVQYTLQTLAERLGDEAHPARDFVRDVLSGPKRWIAGTAAGITPIATAAGIEARHVSGAAA